MARSSSPGHCHSHRLDLTTGMEATRGANIRKLSPLKPGDPDSEARPLVLVHWSDQRIFSPDPPAGQEFRLDIDHQTEGEAGDLQTGLSECDRSRALDALDRPAPPSRNPL